MATDSSNKVPNVPPLRFPEFTDEWKETTIGTIATVVGGGTPDTTQKENWDGDILWYTPSEIGKEKYVSNSARRITTIGLKKSGAKLLPKGTILLTSRATIGECSIALYECTTNQGFQSLIANPAVNNEFLFYLISSKRKELLKRACGSTFLEISANEVRKIKVKSPSIEEQNKIGFLLSLIDERIATQIKIIDKLQSLMSGITQRIRHSQGTNNVLLKDLLFERVEKNQEQYAVHSVSVSEGVINQVEYLRRSFAATDTSHYSVVHYGDIVYTKSPTGSFPYGIVKRSWIEGNAAVSPLYGVYKPLNDDVGRYLHYYFCSPSNAQNYLHKLIQKGAKNTINITNQRFLENYVPIPPAKALQHYVRLMTSLSEKLKFEQDIYNSLSCQKSYLLQRMFI